jgi:uncharacterized membrane protein YfcA
MVLTRILLGIVAVTVWFLAWGALQRRLRGGEAGEASPPFRAALPATVTEAVLLTLFAGLWFGSLGAGGAPLLFLLVGALLEIPPRLRNGTLNWKPAAGGILRIVVAGVLLGWLLG